MEGPGLNVQQRVNLSDFLRQVRQLDAKDALCSLPSIKDEEKACIYIYSHVA